MEKAFSDTLLIKFRIRHFHPAFNDYKSVINRQLTNSEAKIEALEIKMQPLILNRYIFHKIGIIPSSSATTSYRSIGIIAVILNFSAFVATLFYAIRYLKTDPVGVLSGLAQNTAVFGFCYTIIVSFIYSAKLSKALSRVQVMVQQREIQRLLTQKHYSKSRNEFVMPLYCYFIISR